MNTPQDIILKPVITERSMDNLQLGKYTFKVAKNATKPEIKKAVEKLFGVEVAKVTTMNVKGKLKRVGRYQGMTSSWKKAIVTLTENSKAIEFFEGMV
ncbi:MAG: 50S ribosomal protein L23 [Ruminococcus sp.]|nr:50S ribosomal protein L23 [Ruminococcus sp.]